MADNELSGSIKALLDEYKKAISELIVLINQLSDESLTAIVDEETTDPDCKSIQTILAHVVCSGYGYTVYMENAIGLNKTRPEKVPFHQVGQYVAQLWLMFEYCENFFSTNNNLDIEQVDNSKKITVNWGQQYDIEQLQEHAIVHILRHRRQIENLIKRSTLKNSEAID
jgi:hypothetical protein